MAVLSTPIVLLWLWIRGGDSDKAGPGYSPTYYK
jgi:hypothetical protein